MNSFKQLSIRYKIVSSPVSFILYTGSEIWIFQASVPTPNKCLNYGSNPATWLLNTSHQIKYLFLNFMFSAKSKKQWTPFNSLVLVFILLILFISGEFLQIFKTLLGIQTDLRNVGIIMKLLACQYVHISRYHKQITGI